MTASEIDRCRKRVEQFLTDLPEPLGRRERRQWSSVYVRGLLLDGERKSIEPLAARLPEGNVQAMQQLIGQSPWAWGPVWQRLAQRMTAEWAPDPVWVIDDTGFPKQGRSSVGVERQYSGTLGKIANCQVAVSLHQAGTEESTILGWRLYLPERWTGDAERRGGAGRRRLRGSHGVSRRLGGWKAPLRGRCLFLSGGVDLAASGAPTESSRSRTSAHGLSLRRAAPLLGPRSGGEGPGMEAGALAGRHERLAAVALLRLPCPALARI